MKILPWWRNEDVAKHGAPKRIYVSGRLGTLMIGERAQVWFPLVGNTDLWFWVAWHPPRTWERLVLRRFRYRVTYVPLLGELRRRRR
jgi:hypothetical protein